jgi:hypothetical protein
MSAALTAAGLSNIIDTTGAALLLVNSVVCSATAFFEKR